MADAKLTALTPVTTAGANSLLYMVIDPSGTPLSRGITTSNLFFSRTLGSYGVTGLLGANNAVTSTTQFDVSADIAVLRNPTDTPILIFSNTGTLTNNVLTAGPAANGRDQAGAFGANSWLHFYLIAKVDGSGLATLSSTVAPPTGPALPSTYTHWAYCGAVRFDASSHLIAMRLGGAMAFYDITDFGGGGVNRLVNNGTALTMTALDASALIPPNSRTGLFTFWMAASTASASPFGLLVRPTGAAQAGNYVSYVTAPGGSVYAASAITRQYPVSSAQSIDYMIDTAGSGQGAIIDVVGYKMPNGGE